MHRALQGRLAGSSAISVGRSSAVVVVASVVVVVVEEEDDLMDTLTTRRVVGVLADAVTVVVGVVAASVSVDHCDCFDG